MPFPPFLPICAAHLHPPAQIEVCHPISTLAQATPPSQIPAIVEFHYSPTESTPNPIPQSLSPSIHQHAENLGKPITVKDSSLFPEVSPANVPPVAATSTNDPVSMVLIGLNQSGSFPTESRSRYLKTFKRGNDSSRTFSIGEANPQAESDRSPPGSPSSESNSASPVPSESPSPDDLPKEASVIELVADRQEYDSIRNIVYAQGNVEMRFANAVLVADRLRVNLNDRVAVAEGEVILQRGDQTLRGERFEYYFVQDSGVIINANGEIYQPSIARDFSPSLPNSLTNTILPNQTLSDRLAANQPLQRITTTEGYSFGFGSSSVGGDPLGTDRGPEGSGMINRVRFQAERVNFDSQGWTAENVRLTNDPFSPPELEVQAKTATFRNIAPLVDEVRLSDSRLVFDQQNSIPTFQDRLVFDRRERQPGVISIGYDGTDRGGLYLETGFRLIDNDAVSFEIKPQFLIQKALSSRNFDTEPSFDVTETQDGVLSPGVFGAVVNLETTFSPRTDFQAIGSFSSFDFNELENNVRARVALRHRGGELSNPFDYRLEYNYRERLFNGTLGFQTVNSSFGAIAVSPAIDLGNNFSLSYQGSIQNIEAPTDRTNLIPPNATDNVITLMRYQGAAALRHYYFLWLGQALPPTPEEGLKYTPTPVLPYLQLLTGITGVASYYSSGDNQPSITGSIGISGQFGHFSKPMLDYTGLTLIFSQALRGDESPFFFDRFVDTKTLSWGITQQVYGPVRVGAQGSINLDTSEEISTDYFIEYSRRTYNVLIRYNPVLEVGSINLRISDFNWSGNPGPFDGTGIRPVIDGVVR
jgi:hypothetical protein